MGNGTIGENIARYEILAQCCVITAPGLAEKARRKANRLRSLVDHAPHKTPGQMAYEADVSARPHYHDGTPRKAWGMLCDVARLSWEKNPAPRP